jgi:hypothetical protein
LKSVQDSLSKSEIWNQARNVCLIPSAQDALAGDPFGKADENRTQITKITSLYRIGKTTHQTIGELLAKLEILEVCWESYSNTVFIYICCATVALGKGNNFDFSVVEAQEALEA